MEGNGQVSEPPHFFPKACALVCHDGERIEKRQGCGVCRWIKFEEDVEEGGNRWSKPHVATLSLHSLFELRSLLLNNIVMLDMEAGSLDQIADLILDNMISAGHLDASIRDKVREALLRRHRHLHEKSEKKHHNNASSNMSRLPIIRSLAEIGKSHSSSKSMFQSLLRCSLTLFFFLSLSYPVCLRPDHNLFYIPMMSRVAHLCLSLHKTVTTNGFHAFKANNVVDLFRFVMLRQFVELVTHVHIVTRFSCSECFSERLARTVLPTSRLTFCLQKCKSCRVPTFFSNFLHNQRTL